MILQGLRPPLIKGTIRSTKMYVVYIIIDFKCLEPIMYKMFLNLYNVKFRRPFFRIEAVVLEYEITILNLKGCHFRITSW